MGSENRSRRTETEQSAQLEGARWKEVGKSCWGVLARIPPGNGECACLALMKKACRLTSWSGLTHWAYDPKSSLATLQHMNLGSKSKKDQPNSKILLRLTINLKSGGIPSGSTMVLNYTASPQPGRL